MALSKIKTTELKGMNKITPSLSTDKMFTTLTESSASSRVYGCYLDMKERDDKYLFLVKNSNTENATITIKAGNSIQATCDLVSNEIKPNEYVAFMIDSGHFKWVTPNFKDGLGYIDREQKITHNSSDFNEKGKVFITANKTNVGICVFQMPV